MGLAPPKNENGILAILTSYDYNKDGSMTQFEFYDAFKNIQGIKEGMFNYRKL